MVPLVDRSHEWVGKIDLRHGETLNVFHGVSVSLLARSGIRESDKGYG